MFQVSLSDSVVDWYFYENLPSGLKNTFLCKLWFGSKIFFPNFLSIVFVCFSKAFCNLLIVNLASSIICFWLEGNISSPVRYSHLSLLPDYQAGIFSASLLISYCSFSSWIWSSIVIIFIIYIFQKTKLYY